MLMLLIHDLSSLFWRETTKVYPGRSYGVLLGIRRTCFSVKSIETRSPECANLTVSFQAEDHQTIMSDKTPTNAPP